MRPFVVKPVSALKGEISLLGDKSISHRSIILSALSKGATVIKNFPLNKDCLFTLNAFNKLGIKIIRKNNPKGLSATLKIYGNGFFGLKECKNDIFVGDSGTTLRLLLGVLAGQDFKTRLVCGKSLSQRPMSRVTKPLRMMGSKIQARKVVRNSETEEYPPVTIKGGEIRALTYKMPVASAQVKSAILLAALFADGKTKVTEDFKTRDHTERMLKLFKANIRVKKNTITLKGKKELVSPGTITVPGDISSAAFFMVLAALTENSNIKLRNLTLNPTRAGILNVLKKMGADLMIKHSRRNMSGFEQVGDIIIRGSSLKAAKIKKREVPFLIDELPVLMVAASLAKGKSVFEGVGELRVKETDRIRSMSENLTRMGAKITISKTKDGENIIIEGVKQLTGAKVRSFKDHRTALSMVVAGALAAGKTKIDDISCINKSFPGFFDLFNRLKH